MNETHKPEWLITNRALKLFSKYEEESRKELKMFVAKEVPKELMEKLDSIKWPSILGGEEFTKKIKKMLKGKENIIRKREVPEYKILEEKKLIDENQLKDFMMKEIGVFEAKGSRTLSKKRRAVVYIIKEKTQKSNREIAEIIGGITDAAISLQYRTAVDEVARGRGCYKEVKQYLKEHNF